jgi:hypothetical protein
MLGFVPYPTLYLNKCQVKCSFFGSQDAVPNLELEACNVDLRLAVVMFALENGWYPKRTRSSFSLHRQGCLWRIEEACPRSGDQNVCEFMCWNGYREIKV